MAAPTQARLFTTPSSAIPTSTGKKRSVTAKAGGQPFLCRASVTIQSTNQTVQANIGSKKYVLLTRQHEGRSAVTGLLAASLQARRSNPASSRTRGAYDLPNHSGTPLSLIEALEGRREASSNSRRASARAAYRRSRAGARSEVPRFEGPHRSTRSPPCIGGVRSNSPIADRS
jgi:hypothetical protein